VAMEGLASIAGASELNPGTCRRAPETDLPPGLWPSRSLLLIRES
jgi:hypothetical protein